VSLASLLTEAVTVISAGEPTTDPYGNEVPSDGVAATYFGRLEQTAATEVTRDRDAVVSDWVLYLPAHATVSAYDHVVARGSRFEVVSSPDLLRTPQGPHHLAVRLQYLEG
jgi:hypothetical protein